jgi:hypothetical protein
MRTGLLLASALALFPTLTLAGPHDAGRTQNQEVEARSYRNRAVAEGIAERFDLKSSRSRRKLQVRRNTGTIATRLVQADDGYWSVLTDYLSPSAKRGWPIGIS